MTDSKSLELLSKQLSALGLKNVTDYLIDNTKTGAKNMPINHALRYRVGMRECAVGLCQKIDRSIEEWLI
jgi:3-deoxy-D-arabino-heptulosonate 7-phosphate (DAHP) synthase